MEFNDTEVHISLFRSASYYSGNDYLGQEYYEIRQTARTATTFSVEIQIFGVTNLWILAVAYLAVDPTFPHHLNSFDNVPINYTAGNIVIFAPLRSTSAANPPR
jgi:hypothetical protein